MIIYVWRYIFNHNSFIHSSISEQLGCFYVLAIIIILLQTRRCVYLVEFVFSLPLDIIPEVEMLDHMVVLFLISRGSVITAFHGGCTNLLSPHHGTRVFLLFRFPSAFCIISISSFLFSLFVLVSDCDISLNRVAVLASVFMYFKKLFDHPCMNTDSQGLLHWMVVRLLHLGGNPQLSVTLYLFSCT